MKIILAPDPVLKKVAEPVTKFNEEIKQLAEDMLETMYSAFGIGLAANQVGVLKRILVMDVTPRDAEKKPVVMINPKIIWSSDEVCTKEEGCLSVPSYYGEVERPALVKVSYYDVNGKEHTVECDGWESACVQHEIDHLNGILFPEHLSRLRRDIIMKKMKKDKLLYEEEGRGDLYAEENRRREF